MKIAGNLTIQNWKELAKNLDTQKDENWGLAYNFFEERINTRYINPINVILEMKDNLGEGFAVVNLQCSLIETIESFINGCIHEYDINSEKLKWKRKGRIIFHSNKLIFKSFFKNREPFKSQVPNIKGNDFYEYVRCPLLHETQTKNNWLIKLDKEKTVLAYQEIKNDKEIEKIIYRENFQRDLEILVDNYKNAIINGEIFCGIKPEELRENFIAKFNHICDKS